MGDNQFECSDEDCYLQFVKDHLNISMFFGISLLVAVICFLLGSYGYELREACTKNTDSLAKPAKDYGSADTIEV